LRHARVALSPGYEFGAPGIGFARLNFATTPEVLDLVIDRIVEAVHAG
jgi:cystathionine beta-lyase